MPHASQRPHVLNWLRQSLATMKKSEQKIANAILQSPHDIIHMRITDIASEAQVSEPSIVRFCRTAGFESFQKLKVTLAQQLAAQNSPVAYPIEASDSVQEIGQKVFQGVNASLQQVYNQVQWQEVEKVIEKIADSNRLFLFGYGASAAVGADAQHKFFRLNLATQMCSDPDTQMMMAKLMQTGDTVIAISRTGRNSNLLEACKIAKTSGANIISLSPLLSHLASSAHININVELDEDTDQFTPMASRLAQLTILDTIATSLFLRLSR